MKKKLIASTTLSLLAAFSSPHALACASCGCSLNSDWGTLATAGEPAWSVDVRYDRLDQNQLRSGTSTISPASAAQVINPTTGQPAEVERYTNNSYLTTTLDYNQGDTWGVSLVLPYISRTHSTLGTGSDGVTLGSGSGGYDSGISGMGDIRLIARYYGFTEDRNWGVQYGVKLPTGYSGQLASDGVTPVDPGLQLGTGTTDLILGVYYLGEVSTTVDYFAQAQYQFALSYGYYNAGSPATTPGSYRPGDSLNLTAGVRYHGWDGMVPELQVNARQVATDTGTAADRYSTGGTLVYLTPGVNVPIDDKLMLRVNVQLPIYQNLNGIQLTPTAIYSVGVLYRF